MSKNSLAAYLANRMADLDFAERPLDRKIADAVLNAACETANRVGYGMTSSHVRQVVRAFMDSHPAPGGVGSAAVKAWFTAVDMELEPALKAIQE